MTQPELKECRLALKNKQAELVYENRGRGALAVEETADELDRTQGSQARDLAIESMDRNAQLLRNVRWALSRMETGTFGVCLNCEMPIVGKRLAAVPWASLCLNCQELEDAARRGSAGAMDDSLMSAG